MACYCAPIYNRSLARCPRTGNPSLVRHRSIGQGESKCRTLADLALYPDLSAMQLDKLLSQG